MNNNGTASRDHHRAGDDAGTSRHSSWALALGPQHRCDTLWRQKRQSAGAGEALRLFALVIVVFVSVSLTRYFTRLEDPRLFLKFVFHIFCRVE